jgi:hypothetical protein
VFLRPDGRIDLGHRAFFLRGTPGRTVVVAAEDGHVSILAPDLKAARSLRLPSRLRAVSPHPSDRRLAVVEGDSGSLLVLDHAGRRLFGIDPPPFDGDAPRWVERGFDDCLFDETGEFLWLGARLDVERCEILLIETAGWSVVARAALTDPFGGSSLSFHPTRTPGLSSLWLAAGQDGQRFYWLKRSRGGITCAPEPRLENTTPPVFSPSGEQSLVLDDANAIRRYRFPDMRPLGSPLESGDDDDPFAESMAYLDDQRALIGSGEGRIFVADLNSTSIDEVVLEGHEPRPVGAYYPNLSHEGGSATDISHFVSLGEMIFFVFRRDRGTGLAGWDDSLVWVSANRAARSPER